MPYDSMRDAEAEAWHNYHHPSWHTIHDVFLAGFRAARESRAEMPITAEILDLIQSCLEVAGVGEVILDEQTARAFLAEHRGVKAVTG